MLFPKDRPIYPRLRTSFVRFDALIADLEDDRVTCCLHAEFSGLSGWILFHEGEPAGSLAREGSTRHTGPTAARRIHTRAAQPGGTIEVYALEPGVVRSLAATIESVPLYEGLSTDFANPDRLLARLREDRHSGHIDIILDNGRGEGTILLEDGEVVRAVLLSDGRTFAGPDVIQSIVQLAANHGAVFNVYRAAGAGGHTPGRPSSAPPPPDIDELSGFWSEMLARAERTVDQLAPGRFAETFAEVVSERAAAVPYLEPHAGRFTYGDGVARFEGEPPADISGELGTCLLDTLARLSFRLKRADLESRVLAEISELHTLHPEMAHHFPLRAQALVS